MVLEVTKSKKILGLPPLVVSPIDLGRLVREIESIDDRFLQLGLRHTSHSAGLMPKTSQLMDQTVELNKLNLLHLADRKLLHQFFIVN